jgi:two-component system, sensor histidine kinase PhcS
MQVAPEILAAYRQRDEDVSMRKARLACLFGIVMVPGFWLLDYFKYPEFQCEFLWVRLGCACLLVLALWGFGTSVGRHFHRAQGTIVLLLPVICICWMIYRTEGPGSPYYAGLTLVLLVLAVILDWSFWQSMTFVALTLALYLLTCWAGGRVDDAGLFLNNCVFVLSTGVAIAIGAYFHSNLRLSEFTSNYQLNRSRAELASQNTVLQSTLQQLKETESQLVQTEKIVSLGRLSAGLIHEINNPLNYATTGLYILKNQGRRLASESPEEFTEVVQDINEGVERVKNIVSDLRTFSHPDADQRDTVKVAEVITSSIRFLGSEWKEKVAIEHEVPPELVSLANKNKLTQVFVNLIQNALDALKNRPAGGEPPCIRITGRAENGRVILLVRDNGEGIEPKNLEKIFDPFFTTREIGRGMGMGLSICFRIVQEHGGTLSVTSERGKFCEFRLDLPDARAASMAA